MGKKTVKVALGGGLQAAAHVPVASATAQEMKIIANNLAGGGVFIGRGVKMAKYQSKAARSRRDLWPTFNGSMY